MTDDLKESLLRAKERAKDLTDDIEAALSQIPDDCPKEPCVPAPKPDPASETSWPKPFFGGKYAPWAIPSVAGIRRHPQQERLRREFFHMCDGSINLNAFEWAIAIYYFNDDTPRAKLDIVHANWGNMVDGQEIPWDPKWKHANDGDSYVTVVHESTGECYQIWKTRYDHGRNVMNCGLATWLTASAHPHTGKVGNIWEKENGFFPSRAAGIAQPHMLVTPKELREGAINHCLAVGLVHPSREHYAPAIKAAGNEGSDDNNRLGTGPRFQFDLSDGEINDWSNRFSGEMRRHAQTFGACIRDYGFLITDHAGRAGKKNGAVYMENDLSANWSSVGVTKEVSFMLHSLLKPNLDKVWFAEEPDFPRGDIERTAVYTEVDYPEEYKK